MEGPRRLIPRAADKARNKAHHPGTGEKVRTMIVEYVLFKTPPGLTREQVLEGARHTIQRWQANKELIRKHYIESEDGYGGAFYIWPSKEAAQRGHDADWRAGVEKRTGAAPVIRYFDLLMILDNEAGKVTEYPPNMQAEAAE